MLVYVVVVFCSWCVWKTHNPLFNYVNVNLASYDFENTERTTKKSEANAQRTLLGEKRTETRQKLSHIFAS